MGNELSAATYEGPPEVLEARDIASVAKYMKSDACQNVFIMDGAGVSTSAGIPDFRSPGTGLYHNLERLNLPYPEAVFEINFFRENPMPFYTLARELMPGKYRPTPTHSFVKLLHNRGLLRMCYTQNIDTLERLAGLPDDAIVEAHGSFANQHCIECGASYDEDKLRGQILRGEVAHCDQCGGLVKPDIVFFGESLPARFHKTIGLLRSADLLIIMGTSLKVHPFATLTQLVPENCPRVLINLDPAGDIGTRSDDVVLLGKTDDVVHDLCKELGDDWEDELNALWQETAKYAHAEGAEAELKQEKLVAAEGKVPESALEKEKALLEAVGEENLKEAVEKITQEIETSLHIGAVPAREGSPSAVSEPQAKGGTETETEKVATAGKTDSTEGTLAAGRTGQEDVQKEGKQEITQEAVTSDETASDEGKDEVPKDAAGDTGSKTVALQAESNEVKHNESAESNEVEEKSSASQTTIATEKPATEGKL